MPCRLKTLMLYSRMIKPFISITMVPLFAIDELILGYPAELQGLLFHRPLLDRVTIEGYNEEGTTTTPFSMMLYNQTSRFHVAIAAVRKAKNPRVLIERQQLLATLEHAVKKAHVALLRDGTNNRNTHLNMARTPMIVMRCPNLIIGNQRRVSLSLDLVIKLKISSSTEMDKLYIGIHIHLLVGEFIS
jgi:XFP C-terminal domain